MNKGDILYWARIIPNVGIYDVIDLKIRTVEDTWFVGIDNRDKQAYLFNNLSIDKTVFVNREDALYKVIDAEENKPKKKFETEYEEY